MVVPQRRRPEPTPLTVSVDRANPDAPTIRIGGDLSFTTSGPLRAEVDKLLTEHPPAIVLDFGELLFIDSTGLSVIVHAWREGQQSGTTLRLRSAPRFLETILDMTGVTGLLARPQRPTRADLPEAGTAAGATASA